MEAVEDQVKNDLTHAIVNSRTMATQEQLLDAYINGMVAAAKDSHTYYIRGRNPVPVDTLATPNYGFRFSFDHLWAVVSYVRLGFPAELGGLRVGDVVLSINGARPGYVTPKNLEKGMDLKVLRQGKSVELHLEPNFDEPPPIDIGLLDGGLGYIRIPTFSVEPSRFRSELNRSMDVLRGTDGVVIDLRSNPGGSVENVTALASVFGYNGTVAVVQDRDGNSGTFEASPTSSSAWLFGSPIVVLINGDTSSAGEVAAYVFQESLSARLIGTKTAGSVRAGGVSTFGTGRLFVGIARVLVGRSGKEIEGIGVAPDVEIDIDYKKLRRGTDSVLEHAIQTFGGPPR